MKVLSSLEVGQFATVKEIEKNSPLRKRLLDIGLIPGTKVKCILKSVTGNPKAYFFRGNVTAIRNEDAQKVIIE